MIFTNSNHNFDIQFCTYECLFSQLAITVVLA